MERSNLNVTVISVKILGIYNLKSNFAVLHESHMNGIVKLNGLICKEENGR